MEAVLQQLNLGTLIGKFNQERIDLQVTLALTDSTLTNFRVVVAKKIASQVEQERRLCAHTVRSASNYGRKKQPQSLRDPGRQAVTESALCC